MKHLNHIACAGNRGLQCGAPSCATRPPGAAPPQTLSVHYMHAAPDSYLADLPQLGAGHSKRDDREPGWVIAALMINMGGCHPGLTANAVECLEDTIYFDLEQEAIAVGQA